MDNNIKDEDPVFTSTQINDTKSRSSGDYFKNIQKASLWQKLTTSYAKYRNDSIERQKASAEAGKAKRAKRRAEADLKAMSVNIPTAAENGNPALMNTHYAPPPRAKANPLVMAGLGLLAVGLVVGIVLLIVKPWQVEPIELPTYVDDYYDDEEYEEDEGSDVDYVIEGDYDESLSVYMNNPDTFDINKADRSAGMQYVRDVVTKSGANNYYIENENGAYDPELTIEYIDQVVSESGITDRNLLTLFELEKARIYASMEMPEKALEILESVDPENFNVCQLGMYYDAYRLYYEAMNDDPQMNAYIRLFYDLPVALDEGEE